MIYHPNVLEAHVLAMLLKFEAARGGSNLDPAVGVFDLRVVAFVFCLSVCIYDLPSWQN